MFQKRFSKLKKNFRPKKNREVKFLNQSSHFNTENEKNISEEKKSVKTENYIPFYVLRYFWLGLFWLTLLYILNQKVQKKLLKYLH